MRGYICGALLLLTSTAVAQQPGNELRLGMLQGMFRDVKPVMVQAMSRPFRELMLKQTGYNGDVELCPDALTLAEKMKDKSVQVGVFHGFEFAWAQQKCPDLVPLVVTKPMGGKVQAMIVVRKDSPFQTLADLKSETIFVPRGAKAHSLAFLEKARSGVNKGVAMPVAKPDMTSEDVLTAVVSGDATAALVDAASAEGYKQLQPGAVKHLRVLQRSEEFPAAVVAYRKGTLGEAEATRLLASLADAQKTPSGKMLLTLWNLNGFEAPPATYPAQLAEILKAYPCPTESPATIRTAGAQENGGK